MFWLNVGSMVIKADLYEDNSLLEYLGLIVIVIPKILIFKKTILS